MVSKNAKPTEKGLFIALLSIHGLIRGEELELGRDPDTGGQTLYVVELARALAQQDGVARVELFTRRVGDSAVDEIYAERFEKLSPRARIVRIDCGPEEYIRKEELWDHLDFFADNLLEYFREDGAQPDLIHSHYADAGYVGLKVASSLGLPLVFTGHSLGRVKRRRLLASGLSGKEIELRYHMSRRIEAEEETLSVAHRVVASTDNEVREQYELYDHYRPDQMCVIPPGTNLQRFHPPDGKEQRSPIVAELRRFLTDPEKPMILAISRPDERKNISTLIEAYGASPQLREKANLVVVAGNRDDIREMDDGSARVLLDLLLEIDRSDLYGKVAYPKHHGPEDVPTLYRLAAAGGGVFINPALTEPFGLTLIEAAASGVPIVATEDGGPRDIIANCRNGVVIDPLDSVKMAEVLLEALTDRDTWKARSTQGLVGVEKHYSWAAHSKRYVQEMRPVLRASEPRPQPQLLRRPMLYHDRALFTDLDQNLMGDSRSLSKFVELMRANRKQATFGIATGRTLESALQLMRLLGIPQPDVLITSVGTRIHYGPTMTEDSAWERHIDYLWTPRAVRNLLASLPGLALQPRRELSRYKLSYFYNPELGPSVEEIASLLRSHEQSVNLLASFGQYIDIVPVRASKGSALRWFSEHWDVPLERILAAGGSGTDEDMLRGNTLAVVVANRHKEELSQLVDVDRSISPSGRTRLACSRPSSTTTSTENVACPTPLEAALPWDQSCSARIWTGPSFPMGMPRNRPRRASVLLAWWSAPRSPWRM